MVLAKYRLNTKITQISARIVTTKSRYEHITNQICTFDDPSFTDILFMKTGGKSLHFGNILSIDKYRRKGKEIWTIEATKGIFELQILNRPSWTYIESHTKKSNVYSMESRRFIKNFLDSFNIENLLRNIGFNNFSANQNKTLQTRTLQTRALQ